jgi:hypothetical protein
VGWRECGPARFYGCQPGGGGNGPVDLLKYAIKVREVSIELEAG